MYSNTPITSSTPSEVALLQTERTYLDAVANNHRLPEGERAEARQAAAAITARIRSLLLPSQSTAMMIAVGAAESERKLVAAAPARMTRNERIALGRQMNRDGYLSTEIAVAIGCRTGHEAFEFLKNAGVGLKKRRNRTVYAATREAVLADMRKHVLAGGPLTNEAVLPIAANHGTSEQTAIGIYLAASSEVAEAS